MDTESRLILRKVVIDVVCLFIVGFSVLGFYLFGVPYKRGFFCDDESIRLPFKESTVTSAMLYFVGLVLPICVILAVEWYHYRHGDRQAVYGTFMGYQINAWVRRCYSVIGVFGFGCASNQLLTDIAKYSIGRLRPHFWAVCDPAVNCESEINKHKYIEDFTCQNTNARMLKEARLSFLSGHSSFSAYTMIFVILYIQCRVHWRGSHLLRHLVQFVCFSLAWGTALSRVSNYKHHWSDVLAGSMLGSLIAYLTVKYISDLQLYDYKKVPDAEALQNNGANLTVTASA